MSFTPFYNVADAGGDTSMFPLLGGSATGRLDARTSSSLSYNSATGALTSTTFVGALTGNAATATTAAAWTTARTIGGASIDGSGNISYNSLLGVTTAADKGYYFSGAGTPALFDQTALARTISGRATNTLMRTDLQAAPYGTLILTKPDGTQTPYTDIDVAAAAWLISGGVLFVGEGTWAPTAQILFPDGGVLRGAGQDKSKIVCAGFGTTTAIVKPSDNSVTEDLYIESTGTADITLPWGAGNTDTGFLNGIIRRCHVKGPTDCIYFRPIDASGEICTGYGEELFCESTWDVVAMLGTANNVHDFTIRNSTLIAAGPETVSNGGRSRVVQMTRGALRLENCIMSVTNGGANENIAVKVATAASAEVYGGSIVSTNGGATPLSFSQAGSGTLSKTPDIKYSAGTSGTIINLPLIGKTPSATFISTIDVASASAFRDILGGSSGIFPVSVGGTGRNTSTTAYGLIAAGTTAAGAHQTLAAGATTEILVGGGASALPVWTTATGSGAPVRATSPQLVTPALGVATATSVNTTNATGTANTQIFFGRAGSGDWGVTSGAEGVAGVYIGLANSTTGYFWRSFWNSGTGATANTFKSGSDDTAHVVIEAKAPSGQTADIQQWTVNSSAVATMGASGNPTFNGLAIANAGVDIKNGATSAGVLRIFEDSDAGTNKVSVTVPALSADWTLTLPPNDGDSGQVLTTNGSGTTTWETPSAGTILTVYAAGTAAPITSTPAALNFGTTDPTRTITSAGTWLVHARVMLRADTVSDNHTTILKLRRTNNTAADVANSTTTFRDFLSDLGTVTVDHCIVLPPVVYTTANTDDVITIFAENDFDAVEATEASIVAIKHSN